MKPLLSPWCSSISGHFTSRLSVDEPERLHLLPRCSKNFLNLQECNIIYNSISFLDGNSWHSCVPFSGCLTHSRHSSLPVHSRAKKIDFHVATSVSPVYYLKHKHRNTTLGIKQLELPCHSFEASSHLPNFSIEFRGYPRRRFARDLCSLRVCAESENSNRSWWQRFLFDPIDIEDFPEYFSDVEDDEEGETDGSNEFSENIPNGTSWVKDDIDRMLADDASFAAWQQRIKARTELRESQALGRSPDNDNWEDWLEDSWGDYSSYTGGKDSGWYSPPSDWEKEGLPRSPPDLPERGMSRTMKELLFRIFEDEEEVKDDLAFEDRVFRFTSQNTVKFVAVLITVPWLVAYASHDFLIVPFLNRYVETVPLAAELLDLRESQKLNMVETLKMERQRVRFEAALGKAPALSDEELLEHIREEALELREELRLENRKAFGNIWSDLLAGLTIFLLLVFNPEKVAIMRLTGSRLFTNISDTGKAFLIILLSDIFLGYHSESGWETVVEMFLDRYGFQADQASIYIFVAIVPVTIDACFKLWVFRNLTRLSPSAAATFKEMKRH